MKTIEFDEKMSIDKNKLETMMILSMYYGEKLMTASKMGTTEVIETIKEWALEFEKEFEDFDWENGMKDYLTEVYNFGDKKLKACVAANFHWDEQAIINLQYIQSYYASADIDMDAFDHNRYLAIMFTLYERNNHIDYDDPGQEDYESTITKWLHKYGRGGYCD